MKNIIRTTFLLAVLISIMLPATYTKANTSNQLTKKFKKQTLIDFVAYNATSSDAYMYLRNTVTNEDFYFYVPANTPGTGTVVGQITQTDDLHEGWVQIVDQTTHNIQLYSNFESNVNYLYATDMAIGCGACATVRIGFN